MPSGKVRTSDVAYLPTLHEIVERAQHFFDRSERVEPMQMVDVDVVRAQSLQTRIASLNQMVPGRSDIVWPNSHLERCFCRDQDALPLASDRLAENRFGQSVRVNVGRVEKIHARIQADVDQTCGLGHIACAPCLEELVSAAKCACAVTQRGYFQSRIA